MRAGRQWRSAALALFLPAAAGGQTPPPAPPPIAVITEYNIPAGSFPHDPALDPGDVLWYTAQRGNKIGRVNPSTGEVTEFAVPTANSGPHGLVSDAAGNIWFTENSAGKVGRLDPRTGQVTEYAMPEAAARDPHTPVFDQRGILWFTIQNANRVGRLDPATGEVRLFPVPTANARPYGIKVDAGGVPWFVEFGTNRLAKIDPQSGAIQEFVIPESSARPRRLAIAPNGDIYFADFNAGRLGRFRRSADGAGGEFKLWDSPSGRNSQPYGIAADQAGMVWYNESAANRIVRFDPRDESFASLAIPTPGSIVRHMEADSVGRLWLAESGIDKIGKVEPAPRLTAAGVVNAAGFSGAQVAPGEIIAIFGTNLSLARMPASSLPLPRELGNTSVTLAGLPVPLFYVSPGQINALAPFETPPGNVMLVVRQGGQPGAFAPGVAGQETSTSLAVAAAAPGIFVAADGVTAAALDAQSGRAVTAENPAAQDSVVTLFASGLGAVSPPVASGAAAPDQEPLSRAALAVSVSIGGRSAEVLLSGLAPRYAGLYQINVRLPSGLPSGAAPIVITAAGAASKSANLPLR